MVESFYSRAQSGRVGASSEEYKKIQSSKKSFKAKRDGETTSKSDSVTSPKSTSSSRPSFLDFAKQPVSVDPSQVNQSIIRFRDNEGEIIGIQDTESKQSIGGRFKEKELLMVESARTERDRVIAKEREKDFLNFAKQPVSVDPSKVDQSIIRYRDDEGEIIGIQDTESKQSIGGRFKEKELLMVESARTERDRVIAKEREKEIQAKTVREAKPTTVIGRLERSRAIQQSKLIRGNAKPVDYVKQLATGVAFSGVSTFEFGKNLITKPIQTVKETVKGIYSLAIGESNLYSVGRTLLEEPAFSTGFVAGEIVTGKGLGEIGKATYRVGDTGISFIRGGYKPVRGEAFTIGETRIKLAQGFESTKESLKKQASLAGQEVTAVSAQRGLFSGTKKEILIDKPKPKITDPELERSFFADPRGRLRQSRLGEGFKSESGYTKRNFFEKQVDFVTEPIIFQQEKPQAVFFKKQTVEDFPASLQQVKEKLLSGKLISVEEAKALENFQLTPSGKFKPVGFLSKESEITLAPGEIITGQRKGFTLIGGRKVNIFEATVKKGEKITDAGKTQRKFSSITSSPTRRTTDISSDIARLGKTSYQVSKSLSNNKYLDSINSLSANSFGRASIFNDQLPLKPYYVNSLKPLISISSNIISKTTSKLYPKKNTLPPLSISNLPPLSISNLPPVKNIKIKKKKSKEEVEGYYAYTKKNGRIKKINKNPQPKTKAINTLLTHIDRTPRASGTIKSSGTKIKNENVNLQSRLLKKFRVDKKNSNRYIEKEKYRIDSKKELIGITKKGIEATKRKKRKTVKK